MKRDCQVSSLSFISQFISIIHRLLSARPTCPWAEQDVLGWDSLCVWHTWESGDQADSVSAGHPERASQADKWYGFFIIPTIHKNN